MITINMRTTCKWFTRREIAGAKTRLFGFGMNPFDAGKTDI